MFTAGNVIRYGTLLAVAFAAASADAQALKTNTDQPVSKITVLPRYNQWTLIEPELRPALKKAVRMAPAQRERLVRSGTPAERGIGIFVADQQGDIAALLSYADLLEDRELTLPFALPTAGVGQHAQRDQTVGEYLTAAYVEWFGVDVDSSPARFKRLFADVSDPDRLVWPWIVRLRRAASDAKQTAQLKKDINALPEDVRWAVLTLGYKNSVYTREEARRLLANLSRVTRAAIVAGVNLLLDEPLFRRNDGALRRVALEECRKLLNAPQP